MANINDQIAFTSLADAVSYAGFVSNSMNLMVSTSQSSSHIGLLNNSISSLNSVVSSVLDAANASSEKTLFNTGEATIVNENALITQVTKSILVSISVVNKITSQLTSVSPLVNKTSSSQISNVTSSLNLSVSTISNLVPGLTANMQNAVQSMISNISKSISNQIVNTLFHGLNVPQQIFTLSSVQFDIQSSIQKTINSLVETVTNNPVVKAIEGLAAAIQSGTVDPPNVDRILETAKAIAEPWLRDFLSATLNSLISGFLFSLLNQLERNSQYDPKTIQAAQNVQSGGGGGPKLHVNCLAPSDFIWKPDSSHGPAAAITGLSWMGASSCYLITATGQRSDASLWSSGPLGDVWLFGQSGDKYGGPITLFIGSNSVQLFDASLRFQGADKADPIGTAPHF